MNDPNVTRDFTSIGAPAEGNAQAPPPSLNSHCSDLRARLRRIEQEVRGIKEWPELQGEQSYQGQHGEMIAQSMLAVRHIEDARMRIGKVLQYSGDGVSIYDKT